MGVTELLQKRKAELAAKNEAEGSVFREAFSKRENVVILPSGVMYQTVFLGDGACPTPSSTIICHYHGTNCKGEVFDSSVTRNKAATFTLSKLIKGWQEVLPNITVGSKFVMVIPPELAYKEAQLNREIGPNSTLMFEVELMAAF